MTTRLRARASAIGAARDCDGTAGRTRRPRSESVGRATPLRRPEALGGGPGHPEARRGRRMGPAHPPPPFDRFGSQTTTASCSPSSNFECLDAIFLHDAEVRAVSALDVKRIS